MEWVFVRHGEPAWVRDGRGVFDPGLTDRGHRQAERLAERLAGERFDAVWVSPARRARETLAPLTERWSRAPQVHPWLVEAKPPADVEGMPLDELRRLFGGSRRRPVAEWWAGLNGAEPLSAFIARVTDGLDAALGGWGAAWREDAAASRTAPRRAHGLLDGAPKDLRVLVVSHAGTTAVSLSHLLGLHQVAWAWERFYLGHAALATARTVPIADGLIFGLRSFHDAEHLDPEDRTR